MNEPAGERANSATNDPAAHLVLVRTLYEDFLYSNSHFFSYESEIEYLAFSWEATAHPHSSVPLPDEAESNGNDRGGDQHPGEEVDPAEVQPDLLPEDDCGPEDGDDGEGAVDDRPVLELDQGGLVVAILCMDWTHEDRLHQAFHLLPCFVILLTCTALTHPWTFALDLFHRRSQWLLAEETGAGDVVLPEGLEVGDEDVVDEDRANSDDLRAASGHHCHQHHDEGCVASKFAQKYLRH